MHPFVVVIYGAIGVGKSSVVETLSDNDDKTVGRRRHDIVCVREPVEAMRKSGALQSVSESASSSGYDLQMLVLSERLSTYWHVQALIRRRDIDRPTIIVSDGHLELDQWIFVDEHVNAGRMSLNEYELYKSCVPFAMSHSPPFMRCPHVYIYLHATPAELLRRVQQRGRSEERSLDVNALHRVVKACDVLTTRLATNPTSVVVTVRTDGVSCDSVVSSVRDIISQEYSTFTTIA